LLHLEEAEADRGIQHWNLKSILISKDLEVSDSFSVPEQLLIERRPSVLIGDPVKVQHTAGGIFFQLFFSVNKLNQKQFHFSKDQSTKEM
jgi:hypothetical protein